MGTFKNENGKTRVGSFLKTVAPDILEMAGDITGINALEKLGKFIGDSEMSDKDKNIAFEMLKFDTEDRKSARELQVAALNQDDIFSKRFSSYFAVGIAFIFFIGFILLFFITIPEKNSDIIYMVFGTLTGAFMTLASFYFGSSTGSKDKSESILQVLKNRKS